MLTIYRKDIDKLLKELTEIKEKRGSIRYEGEIKIIEKFDKKTGEMKDQYIQLTENE